jgi:hypothetical protein
MTNSNFEALKGPFPANDNFQELEAEWRAEHELWKLDQDTPVYPARRQDICGVLMRKIWLEESARRLMCAIR